MSLPRLATYDAAHDMVTKPRKVDWLIDGVLECGGFGLLFGDPATGKSFLALDWACRIATGIEWRGRPVQRGTVLYVCGEGFGGIGRRLRAWSQQTGTSLDGAPLYISRYGENFLSDEMMEETVEEWRSAPSPIRLIVVDTMARATPGMNEDRANEIGKFVERCDDIRDTFPGAAILVLHHSPHSDKGRAKGSIALRGAVDFEAGLMTTSEEGVVKLTCTKLKDGEPFSDTFLRFQPIDLGNGITSAALVECEAPAPRSGKARKVKLSANDKLFLLALGIEPVDESKVRDAFLGRHPSGNRESAAKRYTRARRRGLQRGWFIGGRQDSDSLHRRDHAGSNGRPGRTGGQQIRFQCPATANTTGQTGQ